ncbi:MAG TPA: hypothetical protein VE890_15900, partial [Thermoguttaceae bacterium]|nr:hypothetical protein [Thermoguttaceae bacterium]
MGNTRITRRRWFGHSCSVARRTGRSRSVRFEPLEDRCLLSLSAFEIIGPSGPIADETPEITWAPSAGADSYDLVVDDDPALDSPVLSLERLTTTGYTLTDALGPGTYYVGVTARENLAPVVDPGDDVTIDESSFLLGFGSFTDDDALLDATNHRLSFTVDALPPSDFSITGPSGLMANSTPTVSWQAANGAEAYDLVISTDAAGMVAVQTHENLTATSRVLDPLPDGDYFALVTAKDAVGNRTPAANAGLAF